MHALIGGGRSYAEELGREKRTKVEGTLIVILPLVRLFGHGSESNFLGQREKEFESTSSTILRIKGRTFLSRLVSFFLFIVLTASSSVPAAGSFQWPTCPLTYTSCMWSSYQLSISRHVHPFSVSLASSV